jgi:hypothetical protein
MARLTQFVQYKLFQFLNKFNVKLIMQKNLYIKEDIPIKKLNLIPSKHPTKENFL